MYQDMHLMSKCGEGGAKQGVVPEGDVSDVLAEHSHGAIIKLSILVRETNTSGVGNTLGTRH